MNNVEMEKMGKIKNTVIIVLIILTALSILFGICRHAFGWFGGTSGLGPIVKKEMIIKENVDIIELNAAIADITIKEGNELKVDYCLPEKLVPELIVSNGKLSFDSTGYKAKKANKLGHRSEDYSITITVPADYDMRSIKISLNMGDLNISSINCESITVDANLGDIKLSNITGESLVIHDDCGDVKASNVNVTRIDSSNELGDITFSSITCNSCIFDNSCGDTEVDGTMNSVSIDNNLGDIDLNTVNDESEIAIDVHTDLGSVRVNGRKR